MKARDQQRSRCYAWETREGFCNEQPMDIHEARKFLEKAWRRFGKGRPPFLQDGRGVTRGHGSRERINIPRRYRNRWTILHEASHGLVCYYKFGAHGPEFVRVLIEMLGYFDVADKEQLLTSAKAGRVKVAPRLTTRRLTGARI